MGARAWFDAERGTLLAVQQAAAGLGYDDELYRAEDDDYATANTLTNLGHPHLALGQRERAGEIRRQALDTLELLGREEEAGRLRERLADQ